MKTQTGKKTVHKQSSACAHVGNAPEVLRPIKHAAPKLGGFCKSGAIYCGCPHPLLLQVLACWLHKTHRRALQHATPEPFHSSLACSTSSSSNTHATSGTAYCRMLSLTCCAVHQLNLPLPTQPHRFKAENTCLQHQLLQWYSCHLGNSILPHALLKPLPGVAAVAGAGAHAASAATALHCCCPADPVLNQKGHPAQGNRAAPTL